MRENSGAQPNDSRSGWNSDARFVGLVWLSSRLLLWAFVMMGHLQREARGLSRVPAVGSWQGVSSWWLNPWTTFDSRHYIGIAQGGYTPFRAAFFPFYPLVLRVLGGGSASQNTLALIGIVVSNLAFAGALWLLLRLTRDEWGENVARRAVWLEAFFPAAAFSAAVYTESLFLLLSLGFFWFARRKKWWASAVCGVLAGLTRNSGPILGLALLLDRPKEALSSGEKWRRAACALGPLVAFVAVQLFLRAHLGAAGSSLGVQKEFGRTLTFPLFPILLDARNLLLRPDTWLAFATFPALLACTGSFALLWRYRRRFSPGKLVFVGAVLGLSLTLSWQGEPHTLSSIRYLFGAFPFVQLLALATTEGLRSRRALLYATTAGFLLFFAHSFLFGLKDFLG